MKLMVARSGSISNFYEYKDSKVTKLNLLSFDEHELVGLNTVDYRFNFPRELVCMIVRELYRSLLLSFNFGEACIIATSLDYETLKIVYRDIYGPIEDTTRKQMIHRLCRTFALLESLHDDYLTVPNICEMTPSIMLCVQPSLRYKPVYMPWEFDADFSLMEQTSVPANCIYTGRLMGDTVFVSGTEDAGIIDVTKFCHPIFMFGLTDHTGTLLTSTKHFERTDKFRYFSNLLENIYGHSTAVLYMVKPANQSRNPFITSSDIYITY